MITIYDLSYRLLLMKYETIANDPDFVDFCKRRNLKPNTIKQYLHALGMYTNLIHKSLSEMIEEAEDEEDLGLRLRRRKVKKYLSEFQQHLVDLNYSENSKRTITACIRAYYHEFEIMLPRSFKNSRSDLKQTFYEDLPTMEDISQLLKYTNQLYRAVILLGVSSGLSRAEICSLTFKDLYDALSLETYPETLQELLVRVGEMGDIVPMWKVTRVKTGNEYFTFSSPESIDAIMDYVDDLNNRNDILIKNKRKTIIELTPDTPLFMSRNNGALSATVMSIAYKRLNEKAGFSKVDGKIFIRPHVLRKVFASTLEKNKMPHLMTRWLMGHAIDTTTSAYFKADPQGIKEEYIEIANHLTVNQEITVKSVESEGYTELKEELDHVKGIVEMILDPKTNKTPEFMKGREDIIEHINKNKDKILK